MKDESVYRARRRSLVAAVAAAAVALALSTALPGALALDAVAVDAVEPDPIETAVAVADEVEEAVEVVTETVTEVVKPSPSPAPKPTPSPTPEPSPTAQPSTDGTSGGPAEEGPVPPATSTPRRVPHEPAPVAPERPSGSAVLPDVPAVELDVDETPAAGLPAGLYQQLIDTSNAPRLQPLDLPAPMPVPVLAAARSTQPVLDVLARIDAGPDTMARIIAPFPVAGQATYHADGLAALVVAASGAPVIAAADGHVAALGGGSARLVGADGAVYTYDGLERVNRLLGAGRAVRKGELLGYASQRLVFGIVNRDGIAVAAVPYLDRWLDQALSAAEALAAAHDGVHAPQVAPPEGAVSVAPAAPPSTGQVERSGMTSQLRPELTASEEPSAAGPLVLAIALALLLWRVYSYRRPAPTRNNEGFLDLPPYGGGA